MQISQGQFWDGIWSTLLQAWQGFQPPVQAALIGATTTVVAATIAASMVVWQISRQLQNAITQARHSEILKLQLQIYEEIVAACRKMDRSEVNLRTDIEVFPSILRVCLSYAVRGKSYSTPEQRIPSLMEKKLKFEIATSQMIDVIERWQIIDSRIEVFRLALNSALHDVRNAYRPYFDFVLPLMPTEIPDGPQQGTLLPWTVPNESVIQELETISNALLGAVKKHGSYVSDFQIEMQNRLLGELVDNKIPPRKPIDPNFLPYDLIGMRT